MSGCIRSSFQDRVAPRSASLDVSEQPECIRPCAMPSGARLAGATCAPRVVILSPLDLCARVCALIPRPGFQLVRCYGGVSSHSSLRRQIVPGLAPVVDNPLLEDDSDRNNWGWALGIAERGRALKLACSAGLPSLPIYALPRSKSLSAVRLRLLEGEGRVGVLATFFIKSDLATGSFKKLTPRVRLRSDNLRLIWRRSHPRETELAVLAQDLRGFPCGEPACSPESWRCWPVRTQGRAWLCSGGLDRARSPYSSAVLRQDVEAGEND